MQLSKRSEVPAKIINLLLKGEKGLSELADELEVTKQAILKHLKSLEGRGLIKSRLSTSKPNRKAYSLCSVTFLLSVNEEGYVISCENPGFLDSHFPLLIQISQEKFREALVPYLKSIKHQADSPSIVLFGSVAREEARWKSDIDVALVKEKWLEDEKGNYEELISSVAVEEGTEYSLIPKFVTYSNLKKQEEEGTIEEAIVNEGILIYTRKENDPLWQILIRYKTI